MLEWIAWDSFEFGKVSRLSRYVFPDPYAFHARSYYPLLRCDLCSSSDHNANSCPYYACYAQPDLVSPRDSTVVILTLLDSSLPFAQCTGFNGGEPFRCAAGLSGVSACLEWEDTLIWRIIKWTLL